MEKINLNNIENIIFDLGGVIVNLDMERTLNEFKKCKPDFELFDNKGFLKAPFLLQYEIGQVSSDAFRQRLREQLTFTEDDNKFDECWNAMLLDIPETRLELLKKLKDKYRLFLLSNTNEIHLTELYKRLNRKYGTEKFIDCFEKEYYSHTSGMRKPETFIFRKVIEENNLNPEKTLFIDDSLPNVETATKEGLQAYHLQKPQTIEEVFSDVLKEEK